MTEIGVIVLLAILGVLALLAVFGAVRTVTRDGYRARDPDPDHDTRRPRP